MAAAFPKMLRTDRERNGFTVGQIAWLEGPEGAPRWNRFSTFQVMTLSVNVASWQD